MCYPCRRTDLLPFSPDRTFGPSNIRLHLTALREHRVHSARGERVPRLWSFACRLLIRALRVTRRRSPRAERTRSAAGEPEPLDGRVKPRTSDHPDERRKRIGRLSGQRGRLPHVGVRFARRGSLGRRRAAGWSSVGGGTSGHEPSARPIVVVGPWGGPIPSASGAHIVTLPHGGASAA